MILRVHGRSSTSQRRMTFGLPGLTTIQCPGRSLLAYLKC